MHIKFCWEWTVGCSCLYRLLTSRTRNRNKRQAYCWRQIDSIGEAMQVSSFVVTAVALSCITTVTGK